MKVRITSIAVLPIAVAVALAFLAYLDPANVWRWSYLMALCR